MNYRYRSNFVYDYPGEGTANEEDIRKSVDFIRKEGELIIEKNTIYEIDSDCFDCLKEIANNKSS